MNRYRIASIPGDGIGSDVLESAQALLQTVAQRHGFSLQFDLFPWSCAYYLEQGQMMPPQWVRTPQALRCPLSGSGGFPRGSRPR